MAMRASSFAAYFWINRLDQINQGLPGHHLIHLGKELLILGALFCGGLLVIGEAKLLAARHLSPGLGLFPYSRSDGLAFPESPWIQPMQVKHRHASYRTASHTLEVPLCCLC